MPPKIRKVSEKRARGRPRVHPEGAGTPSTIRFPDAMREAVDKARARRLDAPDFGTMVRELVAAGLKATASL